VGIFGFSLRFHLGYGAWGPKRSALCSFGRGQEQIAMPYTIAYHPIPSHPIAYTIYHTKTGQPVDAVNVNGHRVHRFSTRCCSCCIAGRIASRISHENHIVSRRKAAMGDVGSPIMTCQSYACHMAYAQRGH